MAKKKIFIVDDEWMFTDMLKLNLEATARFEVKIENSGQNAIESMREFNPDIVFLDVIMPDVDGAQLLQQIEEDDQLKNKAIVFLTALVNKKDTQSPLGGIMAGRPFLAKPVTTEQLINCINKYLQ